MTAVEDEFDQTELAKPQRWSWARVAGIGVSAVGNLFNAVALACQETASAVAEHIAYREDMRTFVDSVSADIGQIATGRYS